MRMAGTEGVGPGNGLRGTTTGAFPTVPMQSVIDALESSVLDDSRSDQLFEQLMARLAAEGVRRRRMQRLWRWIGMGVASLVIGAGAVRLLIL